MRVQDSEVRFLFKIERYKIRNSEIRKFLNCGLFFFSFYSKDFRIETLSMQMYNASVLFIRLTVFTSGATRREAE